MRERLLFSSALASAMIAGLTLAGPAFACSCGPKPDPGAYRGQASVIVEGEVVGLKSPPLGQPGMTRATIRVGAVTKGRAGRVITVSTRSQPEACGFRFTRGQSREFLLRRQGGSFVTDACLMIGARRP